MIRLCIQSAWRVVTSPLLNQFSSNVRVLTRPKLLIPENNSVTYFSRPIAIQPSIKEFLKPNNNFGVQRSCPLTKFSLGKGKRKSVKAVIKRFYRLDWGIWIRTKCGRKKKLYKKKGSRKRRLQQHVFTNATQSWLLDKMVGRYWRKRRYYVDDPYEPYHMREEFSVTRRKPHIPLN